MSDIFGQHLKIYPVLEVCLLPPLMVMPWWKSHWFLNCIAKTFAVMALAQTSVGLLACAGGTQNLPTLVGEVCTKRLILRGQ